MCSKTDDPTQHDTQRICANDGCKRKAYSHNELHSSSYAIRECKHAYCRECEGTIVSEAVSGAKYGNA